MFDMFTRNINKSEPTNVSHPPPQPNKPTEPNSIFSRITQALGTFRACIVKLDCMRNSYTNRLDLTNCKPSAPTQPFSCDFPAVKNPKNSVFLNVNEEVNLKTVDKVFEELDNQNSRIWTDEHSYAISPSGVLPINDSAVESDEVEGNGQQSILEQRGYVFADSIYVNQRTGVSVDAYDTTIMHKGKELLYKFAIKTIPLSNESKVEEYSGRREAIANFLLSGEPNVLNIHEIIISKESRDDPCIYIVMQKIQQENTLGGFDYGQPDLVFKNWGISIGDRHEDNQVNGEYFDFSPVKYVDGGPRHAVNRRLNNTTEDDTFSGEFSVSDEFSVATSEAVENHNSVSPMPDLSDESSTEENRPMLPGEPENLLPKKPDPPGNTEFISQ